MTTDHLSDSTRYIVNTFEHVWARRLGGGGPVLGGHPDPDPTPMNPTIPAPPSDSFLYSWQSPFYEHNHLDRQY